MKRHRLPARITLALGLVLITAAWNLIRLWSSLTLGGVLQKYAPRPGPAYIGITGAIAAGLSFVLLWGFWRRAGWAPPALLGGAIGYSAWIWLDRLIFQPGLYSGWQFSLLLTVALLAYVAAVALDPRNRFYFGREAHEREDEDRATA